MPRGGKRSGAGRKPGSKMTKTAVIAHRLADEGVTPLEFVLAVMRDDMQPLGLRVDCAKAALPHIHPRLSSIQQTVKSDGTLKNILAQIHAEEAKLCGPVIEMQDSLSQR